MCIYDKQLSGADPGFLKGGGGPGADTRFFTTTTPLGHCPRDVIRPQKIEKDPRSWTFTSTPPWTLSAWRHPPSENWKGPPLLDIHKHTPLGHCPCDVIHRIRHCILGLQAKKGGGPTLGPMLKSLHRGPKGGVRTPPPPPGSATGYRGKRRINACYWGSFCIQHDMSWQLVGVQTCALTLRSVLPPSVEYL